jgi:hypothetical protein
MTARVTEDTPTETTVRVRTAGTHGLFVGTLLELISCSPDGVALVRVSHDEIMRLPAVHLTALP